MKLIAFICRGNTCRSPIAEALARREIALRSMDITVASAGVAVDRPGAPADPRAVVVAARHGLELGGHVASSLASDLIERATLLIALDGRTRDYIIGRFQCDPARVVLLTSFVENSTATDIADPYYGTDADYVRAFDEIAAGVAGLMHRL